MWSTIWIIFAVLVFQAVIIQVSSMPVSIDATDGTASSGVENDNSENRRPCPPGLWCDSS